MESIPNRIRNPWVTAALGFLVGLLIGLPLLGWWAWPIQWTDATPAQLREDYRLDYLRMTVISYSLTRDGNLARQRFAALGSGSAELLSLLQQDPTMDPQRLSAFLPVVSDLIPTGGGKATPPAPAPTPAPGPAGRSALVLLLVVCLVTLALGGALLFFLRLRRSRKESSGRESPIQDEAAAPVESANASGAAATALPIHAAAPSAAASAAPLERFVTTYVQGDDLYEDSFTINSPAGEFLGECGVGISEPIGVGEPKKVTAFEVWLFDKRDTRTSTYVLMSEYAFAKEDLRLRLAPRGTPLQASSGSEFLMETQTLRARVQIRELQYGRGPLPANSFFERLTLQLEVSSRG